MTPTLDHLPHPSARMTPARKQSVVEAIQSGSVSRASVIERYGLSAAEMASWEIGYRAHGRAGLAVTKMQRFR